MMSIAWPSECSPSPRQPPYSLTCGKCAQTVRCRVTALETIPDSMDEPDGQGASETSPPPLDGEASEKSEDDDEDADDEAEDEDDDESDGDPVAEAVGVVGFGAAGFGGAGGFGLWSARYAACTQRTRPPCRIWAKPSVRTPVTATWPPADRTARGFPCSRGVAHRFSGAVSHLWPVTGGLRWRVTRLADREIAPVREARDGESAGSIVAVRGADATRAGAAGVAGSAPRPTATPTTVPVTRVAAAAGRTTRRTRRRSRCWTACL